MLTYWAWAKVNLYLEITGRRADGYHELDSLVVFAGVGDRLIFEPAERLNFSAEGPFGGTVPPSSGNLVLTAAKALRQAGGIQLGASIRLDKRLPAAAGLGGGSADAAATLLGLAALWNLSIEERRLREIGMAIGADLPVCLFGRPALVGGAGERIERAPPLPSAWLLLVNPGLALSTKAVFEARHGAFSEIAPAPQVMLDLEALADYLASRRNDLEPAACRLAPAITQVLAAIAALPGCRLARMSGSGASCFGLFAKAGEAVAAAAELTAVQPAWWVQAAPLLHGRLADHWRD